MASSQFASAGYQRNLPRTRYGLSAWLSSNFPGKLCQPHCASVSSGASGEYCSWKVCNPVMSAVNAKFPLPTMNGADLSMVVMVGLCRVTSAWRSMGAATALPASSAMSTQQRRRQVCIAAEYAATAGACARLSEPDRI